MADVGKIFTLLGLMFLIFGLLFNIMPNWPKLPGDIYISKGPFRLYIPFATSILISVVLTLIFNYFKK